MRPNIYRPYEDMGLSTAEWLLGPNLTTPIMQPKSRSTNYACYKYAAQFSHSSSSMPRAAVIISWEQRSCAFFCFIGYSLKWCVQSSSLIYMLKCIRIKMPWV